MRIGRKVGILVARRALEQAPCRGCRTNGTIACCSTRISTGPERRRRASGAPSPAGWPYKDDDFLGGDGLMLDALHRNESCGANVRDDAELSYQAAIAAIVFDVITSTTIATFDVINSTAAAFAVDSTVSALRSTRTFNSSMRSGLDTSRT